MLRDVRITFMSLPVVAPAKPAEVIIKENVPKTQINHIPTFLALKTHTSRLIQQRTTVYNHSYCLFFYELTERRCWKD